MSTACSCIPQLIHSKRIEKFFNTVEAPEDIFELKINLWAKVGYFSIFIFPNIAVGRSLYDFDLDEGISKRRKMKGEWSEDSSVAVISRKKLLIHRIIALILWIWRNTFHSTKYPVLDRINRLLGPFSMQPYTDYTKS